MASKDDEDVRKREAAKELSASPSARNFAAIIRHHLTSTLARHPGAATPRDWWVATALATRDRIHERMIATQAVHNNENVRRVYYFSMEYLMGRLFESNLLATGLTDDAREALTSLGVDFDAVRESEIDMGLGNGGLGRLAACFLDSLTTLDYAALGYGIYYEFGLFKQEFVHGHQIEHPDRWGMFGDPWEVVRPDYTQEVRLYGRVENVFDDLGNSRPRWVGTQTIIGVPHDIPVAGYGTKTVNLLRLWASKASRDFDLAAFNSGGYVEAVREKAVGETISKVLYPNDKTENGKELRLVQQYFFVACSLRDILRRHFRNPVNTWANFSDKVAVQLNDTHPAIAVPELMRILLDEHHMTWEAAWTIVEKTFGYTNHTLLPEALEKWSVPLFERVLPRHLQIIFDVNSRLLQTVELHWPGDVDKKRVCSLVEENGGKMIRMANLAVVGSHAVNGVAALHTALLKKHLFPDFDALYPGKFQNKTNGITPRRWLAQCNPSLSALITKKLGNADWVRDLDKLAGLEKFADEEAFQKQFMAIKRANKAQLAAVIKAAPKPAAHSRALPPAPAESVTGYCPARLHFRGESGSGLRSREEHYPGDQSDWRKDQLGCPDRKSAEDRVFAELPCFARRKDYSGCRSFRANLHCRQGSVRHGQHEARVEWGVDDRNARWCQCRNQGGGRRLPDPFLVLADFRAYSDAQARVDAAYRNPATWARMAILNTARVGKFSSDRTIREYAREIWKLQPVKVP